MSFWSWLTGRKTYESLPDRIWLEDAMATLQCVAEAVTRSKQDLLVIVIAHFSDRVDNVESLLAAAGVDVRRLTDPLSGQRISEYLELGRQGKILVAPAALLQRGDPSQAVPDDRSQISLLVRERHPLRTEDERIENFAATIPYATRLECYLSLDDALLEAFAGEWVRNVLTQMGMKPDEAITSAMVQRRLIGAQRKVEKEALGANPAAANGRQWFAKLPHAGRPRGPWDDKDFRRN